MKKLLLFSVLLLVALSCKTGKRAFEKGDYEKAVLQAVERLRDDTDNEDASRILPVAYKLSLETHQATIQNLKSSLDPYRFEGLTEEYALLNNLANNMQRCPACLRLIKPVRYDAEITNAKREAAAFRVVSAKAKLNDKENRNTAIAAYQDLEIAESYAPNNQEILSLKSEALDYATLRVVVQPLYGRNNLSFGYMEVMNQRLVNYLHNTNINRFVRFYTPQEARNLNLSIIDHEIELGVTYFSPARNTNNETYTLKLDSIPVESSRNGKIRYINAEATVVEHFVEYSSNANLAIFIRADNQSNPLRTEVLSNGFIWGDHWATFRGDERALTKEVKALVDKRPQPQPTPDFLFQATSEPLYEDAVRFLRHFYANY